MSSNCSNPDEGAIPSADEFVRLRSSSDPAEYRRAAHGHASLEVWLDVIHRFPAMRSWVAHNKTVPIEALEVLASDRDEVVRVAVASKHKVTAEILRILARDPSELVRRKVVAHGATPRDVIEALASDPVDAIALAARARLGEKVTAARMSHPPPEDLALAERTGLVFSVTARFDRSHRWEQVGDLMSLGEACMVAHALIASEETFLRKLSDGSGLLYWQSSQPAVFNSAVLSVDPTWPGR